MYYFCECFRFGNNYLATKIPQGLIKNKSKFVNLGGKTQLILKSDYRATYFIVRKNI